MSAKFNPFQPSSPVYSTMFAGRDNEIKGINKSLYQTKHGNPIHIMLLGERGIGKTSLLLLANTLARGKIELPIEKLVYNFITIQVNITESMTIIDFANSIKDKLKRELEKINPGLTVIKKFWEFLSKFDVIGYKNAETSKVEQNQILDHLTFSLIDTIKSLTEESSIKEAGITQKKDGLVILLDETDKASADLNLGGILKNLTENFMIEGCNNVLIIVAGLPNSRDVLRDSHESSLRLFHEHTLSTLTKNEVVQVIKYGIQESNKKSSLKINVSEEALNSIYDYSEGYPHFVQQIGYSVYEYNIDSVIDKEDVTNGFFMKNGALDLIGNRYYKKQYYDDIKTDKQREILNIMANKWNEWVERDFIKKNYKGSKVNLDNGIKALKEKNIILVKQGSRGLYRLQWASFAFWIRVNQKKLSK